MSDRNFVIPSDPNESVRLSLGDMINLTYDEVIRAQASSKNSIHVFNFCSLLNTCHRDHQKMTDPNSTREEYVSALHFYNKGIKYIRHIAFETLQSKDTYSVFFAKSGGKYDLRK